MMDPWKHCPNFSDAVLDAFIKGFPSHPDHAPAVAEFERRREEREQRAEARGHQAEVIPVGKAFLTWAIGGIASLRLRFFPWLFRSLLEGSRRSKHTRSAA
jgi:hypothetical protein